MNLRTFRPRYLGPRLQQLAFERKFPDAPWLTRSAVLFLCSYLRSGDAGFEWGSGRSTVWLAKRVKSLHSVEAIEAWHRRVQDMIVSSNLSARVRYDHIPCELQEIDEPSNHPYAEAIQEWPDESLDFVLVDGHIRATCFEFALPKLRPGGLLILDNANRYIPNHFYDGHTTVHEPRSEPRTARWRDLLHRVETWRAINTSDGIWDTRFWIKPCGSRNT